MPGFAAVCPKCGKLAAGPGRPGDEGRFAAWVRAVIGLDKDFEVATERGARRRREKRLA